MWYNFLVRTLQYFLKKINIFFAPENMKKPTLKSCSLSAQALFFSTANWPKSSPNLNSRSIKIHKISIVTLVSRASTSFVENPIGIMQGYKFENQMLKGLVNTALQ